MNLRKNFQVLAPLPIGFAVFMVHLATIPVTGTGINPARSLGAAVIYNKDKPWDDHVRYSYYVSSPFHCPSCFTPHLPLTDSLLFLFSDLTVL